MPRRLAAISLCLFLGTGAASALMPARYIQVVCPLTGESFETIGPGSYFSSGITLDFEPMAMGRMRSSRFNTPTCPDSGLPLYRDFTAAEIETLREVVGTDEWHRRRSLRSTDYLIAHLRRLLNEGDEAVADSLLQAFWYAGDAEKPEIAAAALRAWSVLADWNRGTDEKSVRANWVRIELLRQSGEFAQADRHLAEFRQARTDAFGAVTQLIIAEEQRLIDARNSNPAPAPQKPS